jgi:glycosyltransferase involved in cell wall biosynthesis
MRVSQKPAAKQLKRIVAGIYTDADFFPPTISAILNFAQVSEEVILISRNNNAVDYPYPSNVRFKKIGRLCSVREMENQPIVIKAIEFLKFSFYLFWFSRNKRCELLALYDHIALFSFFLSKNISGKRNVWYHNHDMPIKGLIKKRSLGGVAASCEEKAMKYIDFFSLPSRERLQFYSHIDKQVPVFIIPNYPSLKVYGNLSPQNKSGETIKIIYQGFIGLGHALEEVIQCLAAYKENGIQLILKGSVTPDYKEKLDNLAQEVGVCDQVQWFKVGPYKELPKLTSSCNIGIGVNKNTDIVNLNQGTASNKIYEYAACGIPVIVFDNEQFRSYLGKYPWVFFTNGSVDSLKEIMSSIKKNASELGKLGRESFEKDLNFEKVFLPVLQKIKATIAKNKAN